MRLEGKGKILCVVDSLGAGGAQRQLVGLAVLLKKEEYDVQVAFYHNNLFYSEYLQKNNVPFVYLKKAQNISFRIFSIAFFIRKVKPDIVISYLDIPNICCCFSKLINPGILLIVSERSFTLSTGWHEKIKYNLYRLADFIVPNSYSQADYIKNNFSFLSKRLVVIPNFVDLEYFSPNYHSRKHIPEIIIVASIYKPKNTLGFIDAVAALKSKGNKFHISWYGLTSIWPEYISACNHKIEKYELQEYIELKDKTSEIKERYQEADYFCLPSFYEGTPNVICEAMACGMPIVCSDVCDNSRYVIERENGFLFNPIDTDSIVSALERLLSLNEQSYNTYCHRSRTIAEQLLSEKRFIKSYIQLIEQ